MGWNPKFNFRLRDDEVTLGDLIMDKETAEMLVNAIKVYKESGQLVDISTMLDYIYTDDELTEVKADYEAVKMDIDFFSSVLKGYGKYDQVFGAFMTPFHDTVNYVIGTTTWLQKYKNAKILAGQLYMECSKCGHDFGTDKQTYDARYGEVVQATTDKERMNALLNEQLMHDLQDGMEFVDAYKKHTEAMVATGVISKEMGKMMATAVGAAGKKYEKGYEDGVRAAENLADIMDEAEEAVANDVKDIIEQDANTVIVTSSDLSDYYAKINPMPDIKEKAKKLDILLSKILIPGEKNNGYTVELPSEFGIKVAQAKSGDQYAYYSMSSFIDETISGLYLRDCTLPEKAIKIPVDKSIIEDLLRDESKVVDFTEKMTEKARAADVEEIQRTNIDMNSAEFAQFP